MMYQSFRRIGVAVAAGSLLMSPGFFAESTVAGAAAAVAACPENGRTCNGATALLLGGRGQYAQLTEDQMIQAFGGYFADYSERISVPFPGEAEFAVSVPQGSDNLYAAIYERQGVPLTIGGVSKGAPSVVDVLYRLMEDAENPDDGITPPDPDHLNVAIYGAPGRMFFVGATRYQPIPETPYDILVVSAEYDGIADFPDNPFNLLAVLNAAKGAELLHVDAAFYDVTSKPVHYRVDENELGGTITTVVIPAERLPLLNDMYNSEFFDPKFTAALERILRPIIDSGYKRNWASQRKYWTFDVPTSLPGPPAAVTADTRMAAGTVDGTRKAVDTAEQNAAAFSAPEGDAFSAAIGGDDDSSDDGAEGPLDDSTDQSGGGTNGAIEDAGGTNEGIESTDETDSTDETESTDQTDQTESTEQTESTDTRDGATGAGGDGGPSNGGSDTGGDTGSGDE